MRQAPVGRLARGVWWSGGLGRAPVCLALGAAAALVAAISAAAVPPTTPDAPVASPSPAVLLPAGAAAEHNLLLITMDTTRADAVGCYGNAAAATPSLDRLAAAGVRFATVYATAPMTSPAHASLLTGLYPPGHGVRSNGEHRLGAELTTAAEILRGHGYRTAAFVSCFVLDARFGLAQGFELYDSTPDRHGGHHERSATAVTDAALAFLAAHPPKQRFFLWVHYFDPHFPYQAPAPWGGRFADRPYAGEVAYMDAEIGRLLAALDGAGLRATTVVTAVGDHGESLGEHLEPFHSHTIYDAAMRVPLIISVPGAAARGAVYERSVVSLVDVLPTLLDLLLPDRPRSAGDGVSLVGEGAPRSRIVYTETLGPYLANSWAPLFGACRLGEKYILAPRPEYYDLTRDPRELDDRLASGAGELPVAAAELRRFLDDYLAGQPGAAAAAATAIPLAADERAGLEALGYVVHAAPGGALADAPDPKDMMPLYHLLGDAQGFLAAGQAQLALEAANAILAKAPRDRAALTIAGEAHLQLGRLGEAERCFRARLEARPEAMGAALLANLLGSQGRFEEAEALLAEAARREPEHGMVPFARGELLTQQGRYADAIGHFERAAQLDPVRFAALAEGRLRTARLLAERAAAQAPASSSPVP